MLAQIAILAASAAVALADSEVFGIVNIRSGSTLQYSSWGYDSDGNIVINGDTGVESVQILDSSALEIKSTSKYIGLVDGQFKVVDKASESSGWEVSDGYLSVGSKAFYACEESGTYYVYDNDKTGSCTSFAARATLSSGSAYDSYTPSGGSSDGDSSESSESSSVEETSTAPVVPTATGAAPARVAAGGAVAAAVAAMLL